VKRSRLQLLLVTATSIAALAAASAASAGVRITGSGNARFPDRLYLLNVDTAQRLSAGNVAVRENGISMQGVQVTPVRDASAGRVGVVLVLDASLSTRGAAAAGALNAARAFVASRSANEKIAIVAFSDRARVLQPFTRDTTKLQEALVAPAALSEGTHIYDAVAAATTMIRKAHIDVGSVVLLSDGADTGSIRSLNATAAFANRARIRVFTIGLRSRAFDPGPLTALAAKTSGSFSETSDPRRLAPIFSALSTRLANEYLVSYRSTAAPGQNVSVTVTVAGSGNAVVSYAAPALPSKPSGPFYLAVRDRFWKSAVAPVVISLLAAVLLGIGVATLLRPRPKTLRKRLGQFVSIPLGEDGNPGSPMLTGRAPRANDATDSGLRLRWLRFCRDVELADLTVAPERIALYMIAAAILIGLLFVLVIGSPVGLVAGLFVPVAVLSSIRRRVRKKRDLFGEQLPDNLQVLASALRAGHSLVGALSVVVNDSEEPTKSEFQRVVADERLGVPLEDALDVVVERMDSRELGQVSLVASLQRRTGGNSAEVLDRVVETIRERAELRRLVKTLTAQGRISRWIVTALPVVLLVAISLLNPHYVAPLVQTGGGRIVLLISAMFVAGGSLVIDRIVDIKI
jgi:tight adherence protein B